MLSLRIIRVDDAALSNLLLSRLRLSSIKDRIHEALARPVGSGLRLAEILCCLINLIQRRLFGI